MGGQGRGANSQAQAEMQVSTSLQLIVVGQPRSEKALRRAKAFAVRDACKAEKEAQRMLDALDAAMAAAQAASRAADAAVARHRAAQDRLRHVALQLDKARDLDPDNHCITAIASEPTRGYLPTDGPSYSAHGNAFMTDGHSLADIDLSFPLPMFGPMFRII